MVSTKGEDKKKAKKTRLHHEEEEEKRNPNRNNKRRRKNGVVTDPRFASVHSDPRFQRMPRKESKVPIDDRFAKVLTDQRFADKRGKPKSKKEVNPMLHYYLHEDENKEKETPKEEEEEGSDGLELEASDEEEEEEEEEEGGGISSSDDEDDDQESVSSHFSHYLMANHEDPPMTEQETHRLAVVNMDWDHIRAVDIFVVMSSCLPKGGQILSVAIYPTEFGLKCIEVEAVRGPSDLIDKNEDDSDDEQEIDDEKLRSYELNKLRYYYAVALFDSSATANHIYNTLDGIELLRTSNVLDLRFIPDSLEFNHPPRDITTEAPINYKQPDFETRALQPSKVNLTWEEDEPHRTKILRQKFNADKVQRGEDANMVTVSLATHRKGENLIDERTSQTYVEYLRLRERTTASAPTAGEAGTSSQPSPAPLADELWVTAAGGLQRGTYYGTGSYDALVVTQSSRASTASVHSPQPSQASVRVQETVDRQIASLRDELLRRMEEQPLSQPQADDATLIARFDKLERNIMELRDMIADLFAFIERSVTELQASQLFMGEKLTMMQDLMVHNSTRLLSTLNSYNDRLAALEQIFSPGAPSSTQIPPTSLPSPSTSVSISREQYDLFLSLMRDGGQPPTDP